LIFYKFWDPPQPPLIRGEKKIREITEITGQKIREITGQKIRGVVKSSCFWLNT